MKDNIWPRSTNERNFVGPGREGKPYRHWQSATRINLPHMPGYLQSFFEFVPPTALIYIVIEYEKGHATTKLACRST